MTDDVEKMDLLLFAVAGQTFALPDAVVEIVMAPQPVTPLPFVPGYVDGVVNAGDRIVPQLALRRLLFPAEAFDGSERGELLIVAMGHAFCALHVSRILGRIHVDAERLVPVQGGAESGESTLFNARCEHEGEVLLVLDPAQLSVLLLPRDAVEGQRGLLGRLQTDEYSDSHDEMPCIVVRVGDERYALALGDVLEILDLPPATPLPGAPALVEGLVLVREDVLLVLSLAQLLRGDGVGANARHVLVIESSQTRYGIRVDSVDGIVAFDARTLREIEDDASDVAGILVHEGSVVGLLTPARLMSPVREALVRLFVPDARQKQVSVPVEMRTVLQVAMGAEDYALPLEQVRRVVPYSPPEALEADAGSLVSAIANIDGEIVPVVDLTAPLSLGQDMVPAVWVIVGAADREWAIPVSRACEILDIPVTSVEFVEGRRSGFLAGVATVDKRLVSLISLAPLATEMELHGGVA